MKLLSQVEGLSIPATVVTANLDKNTLLKITGDATVDKATANSIVIGKLAVPVKTANSTGTVETSCKDLSEMKTTEVLVAGDSWKAGVPDATTGESTAAKWVDGTDSPVRRCGVVWKGAASGGTAQVLTF